MKKNEEYLIGGVVAVAAVGGFAVYYKVTHPIGPPVLAINSSTTTVHVPVDGIYTYSGTNFYSGTPVQAWVSTTSTTSPSPSNGTQGSIGSADFWGNITGSTGAGSAGTVYFAFYDAHRGLYSNIVTIITP